MMVNKQLNIVRQPTIQLLIEMALVWYLHKRFPPLRLQNKQHPEIVLANNEVKLTGKVLGLFINWSEEFRSHLD
jgi:hypothetical protein